MSRQLSNDTKELLRSPLFSRCSQRELSAARSLGTIIDVPAGRLLCREGQYVREMFVILDGVVALSTGGVPLGLQRDGDWSGDITIGRKRHAVTVIAASPATLLVFSIAEFRSLLESCPQAARRLIHGPVRLVEAAGRREALPYGLSA
jgi:CRP-like cAMP-binding protein